MLIVVRVTLVAVWLFFSIAVSAEDYTYDTCLAEYVKYAGEEVNVADVTQACETYLKGKKNNVHKRADVVQQRDKMEAMTRNNPYVITPYKPNYAIFSYNNDPNRNIDFGGREDISSQLDNEELEYQLSIEYQLADDIVKKGNFIAFTFTVHAYWQAFNGKVSSPFRETNYSPELVFGSDGWGSLFGFNNVQNLLIMNHQSNGRSASLSRSWNRIIFNTTFEKGAYVTTFKPWYRLPETKKSYDGDPGGDDNPDIQDYLGYFDWLHLYKTRYGTASLNWRNNLRTDNNRNTVELSYSIPISGRLLGYIKYFDGWGHSMIDYNSHERVLSVGIALNDWY